MIKCDVCDSTKTYIKSYEHNYIIKGKEISFISDRRFCENCNNLVYDDVLDNKASEQAITIYNEKYGIEKEKIVELRKKYNLSLELFSKIIGCAKKTLISYEKGKSIPNDSYLIILKSLIIKPDTILTLINANKEQFTSKELEKINNKLANLSENNLNELSNIEFNPTEFNGYTKISKEKIYNIILYFADNTVLKTKLLKEMFYADFLCYKSMCKSMTGLEYYKLPLGPVPNQYENILNNGVSENIITYESDIINNYEYHSISSIKKFNKDIFDEKELVILKKVKDEFKNFKSKEIVEFSHIEKAFIETEYNKKISYDYAFDIDSI